MIGYRHTIPGDETSKLVKTDTLTAAEKSWSAAAIMLDDEINDLETKLAKAKKGLADLRLKVCTHHVFNDERGFPYHTRTCAICGAYMGTV